MVTRKVASRATDFVLYVAIAAAVFGAIWFYAGYQARNGLAPGLPLNWLGFAGMTLIVFGDAVRSTRRASRTSRFWLLLGAALATQVGVGTLILWNAPRMSTLIWAVLISLDGFALATFLRVFLGGPPNQVAGGPTMR
jgi:hypothetical protein